MKGSGCEVGTQSVTEDLGPADVSEAFVIPF